jgi:hypothetical protein
MSKSDIATPFPPPPIRGTARLKPISSWAEMHGETEVTKVEFDLFWYDSVLDGVAYFFRWLDVLDFFQSDGPGWQERINQALRKAAGK